LNESGINCFAAGNIGDAFTGIVSKVTEDDYVSLETSSFQLDHIKYFKPNFAMILNITPDHLDRYENSFEKYKASKFRIFENQTDEDCLILNADDSTLNNAAETSNVQKYYFSTKKRLNNGAYFENGEFFYTINGESEKVCDAADLFIKGEHNYANALAVLIVAKKIGLSNESIAKAFSSFKGVEHRLEFVREINGIKFINDSKATNVDSVWYALKSFEEKILLILGGKDKGNDYDKIKDLVKEKVRKIYAIGSSKEKVFEFFNSTVEVERKETLQECVKAGLEDAKENEVVLLSPACASFDMFNNYEHRGEVFKEAVMSLN
jgi:UDP-N-acetylmuramoylalanine--D-glutamate ligase